MADYVPFSIDECASPPFLNNFFCHFPFGKTPYETTYPEGFYRGILAEHMHETPGEFTKDAYEYGTYDDERSDKKLNQTYAMFWEEVDSAVVEVGLSLEDVSRVINIYLHGRNVVDRNVAVQMHKAVDSFLFPIYENLRERGYNKQDLWS